MTQDIFKQGRDIRIYCYNGYGGLEKESAPFHKFKSVADALRVIADYRKTPGQIQPGFLRNQAVVVEYTAPYKSQIIQIL